MLKCYCTCRDLLGEKHRFSFQTYVYEVDYFGFVFFGESLPSWMGVMFGGAFVRFLLAENELAASVPRNDVVGKSEYFHFGMRDSLAIEASFLQREDELLSLWWKEYAECSEGPRPEVTSKKKSVKQSTETLSEAYVSSSLYEGEEERVGVPVKGGLYEVPRRAEI